MMESVSAVIGKLMSSNGEKESGALSNVDNTMDKETKSSAEVTPFSITML